jgi:hypothetical protein
MGQGQLITCSVLSWHSGLMHVYPKLIHTLLPFALGQMQAAARAAAAPLPPVVLPPAQAAPPSRAFAVQQAETVAADTSPTAAAAVANLGLQLPVEHGSVLAGDSADGMGRGLPASLLSMAHNARELPDESIAARA